MILTVGKQKISSDKEENWLFCLASGANTIYRISLGVSTATSSSEALRGIPPPPLLDSRLCHND
jgi:hypothetical protein